MKKIKLTNDETQLVIYALNNMVDMFKKLHKNDSLTITYQSKVVLYLKLINKLKNSNNNLTFDEDYEITLFREGIYYELKNIFNSKMNVKYNNNYSDEKKNKLISELSKKESDYKNIIDKI